MAKEVDRCCVGRWCMAILCSLCLIALSGCASAQYAWQAATGHWRLLQSSQPVNEWLARDDLSPRLRDRLLASQAIRHFAVRHLKLPDNQSYRVYADLKRPYAVWNVFIAPPLSFRLVDSCFWIVGCLSYRGFFAEQDAQTFATTWRDQGFDVSVSGIPAYSTLGYTDDPLLNTFIEYPVGELARLIFHELTHQKIYLPNETAFNESLATAVEELGLAAWFDELNAYVNQLSKDGRVCHQYPDVKAWLGCDAEHAKQRVSQIITEYEQFDQRRRQFKGLIFKAKEDLERIYAQTDATDDERLVKKRERYHQLHDAYQAMKVDAWQGWRGYDGFFDASLNNAKLAAMGLYHELVPRFKGLFMEEGGQFEGFYTRVQHDAKAHLFAPQVEASPRTK